MADDEEDGEVGLSDMALSDDLLEGLEGLTGGGDDEDCFLDRFPTNFGHSWTTNSTATLLHRMSRRTPPEVFLNFGGPVGRHIATLLHRMLTRAGIDVFIDENDLPEGNNTSGELIAAISQSKVSSIPIISKDYASSKSCLMELEQMLKCKDNGSHTIIPIFHFVDPSDVRDCNGPFTISLVEHKKRGVSDSVLDSWKSALRRIGKLEGHHFHEKIEV